MTDNCSTEYLIKQNHNPPFYVTNEEKINALVFYKTDAKEVIRIDCDGRVFWNGKEVAGDEEFRLAMIDLRNVFGKNVVSISIKEEANND